MFFDEPRIFGAAYVLKSCVGIELILDMSGNPHLSSLDIFRKSLSNEKP
jgi:hypothetical protein